MFPNVSLYIGYHWCIKFVKIHLIINVFFKSWDKDNLLCMSLVQLSLCKSCFIFVFKYLAINWLKNDHFCFQWTFYIFFEIKLYISHGGALLLDSSNIISVIWNVTWYWSFPYGNYVFFWPSYSWVLRINCSRSFGTWNRKTNMSTLSDLIQIS